MKKLIFLLILPSLLFAQEKSKSKDINQKGEIKRDKIILGLSNYMYDSKPEYLTDQSLSLSLGYVILNNLYLGTEINSEGISLVNRIYLGPELDLYFTYKHRGKIKHGRNIKFGIGGEIFLYKFLSINSELLIYNYNREETKTTTSINLNELISDFSSGISTSQEYINEKYSGGIILIGLQIHF
ncbi:MAG: hypothetical protein CMD02_04090 [Flavobacteriales bacterium]|nr:hypothetical protein [Flavobacteriales bacterium]